MRASPLRTRRVTLLVCGLAVVALAYSLTFWAHLDRVDQAGSDFSASYVAATVWLHGGHLYDQSLEIARHFALIPASYHVGTIDLPFITPPLTAVLVAPLTVLDLPTAYRVASLLEFALLVAAVGLVVRHAPWPARAGAWLRAAAFLGALAGIGGWRLLLHGQWDGVSALSLALAYSSWRQGHRARAAAWLMGGAVLAKPHLAVGLAVWLLAQRNRRALAGAAGAVTAVVAASLLLAGPSACLGWVESLGVAGHYPPPPAGMLGFTGLLGSWLGDTAAAPALAAAASLLALVACWQLGDRARRHPEVLEPSLAGATVLSLLAAPHLLPHDLALLAPALVWTVAWAAAPRAAGGHRLAIVAWGWVILNLAALVDLDRATVAPPGRLTPLVLIGAGVVAARACGARVRSRRPAGLSRRQSIPGTGSGVGGSVE